MVDGERIAADDTAEKLGLEDEDLRGLRTPKRVFYTYRGVSEN